MSQDEPTLMQALDFTADDLDTNRDGHLSPRQMERLRRMRRTSMTIGGGLVVIMMFVATAFLFLGQQDDSAILTLVGIGITLSNAALLGVLARYWLRLGADLSGERVHTINGRAERVIRVTGRRVTSYVLKVNDVPVSLPRDTLKAFVHEGRYSLYRTPYTRILVSAERLG